MQTLKLRKAHGSDGIIAEIYRAIAAMGSKTTNEHTQQDQKRSGASKQLERGGNCAHMQKTRG